MPGLLSKNSTDDIIKCQAIGNIIIYDVDDELIMSQVNFEVEVLHVILRYYII